MKVLFIHHSSGIEGSGLALINIVVGLRQKGVDSIVVLPKNGPLISRLQEREIDYRITPFFESDYCYATTSLKSKLRIPIVWAAHLCYNTISFIKISQIVKKEQIDIIHTNTGVLHLGFYVSIFTGVKHIWHLREYQDRDFSLRPYFGFALFKKFLKCNNNTCIAITNGIFKHFNLQQGRDVVIYDGVAPESYTASRYLGKQDYLIFVGALTENKGILDLLESYNNVSHTIGVELWLVGKDAIGINKLIRQYNLQSKVKYLGVRNDVYNLMNRSKALVVPSKFEGFGFITAEAMLNYCLVIGRDSAGTKEQFDNGQSWTGEEIAWRFDNNKGLEELLLKIDSESTSGLSALLDSAYKAAKNYTIENNVKQIYDLYQRLMR